MEVTRGRSNSYASSFRSTTNNIQDYVPFYRYLPTSERTKLAIENRKKRDVFFEELLNNVQNAAEHGKPISCVSQGLLLDKDTQKLTKGKIQSSSVLNFIRYVVFRLTKNS